MAIGNVASATPHDVDAFRGNDSANQHRGAIISGGGGDVETPVDAVGSVDVPGTGRRVDAAVQPVAATAPGVRRLVVHAKVRFGFHDDAGNTLASKIGGERLSQETARHDNGAWAQAAGGFEVRGVDDFAAFLGPRLARRGFAGSAPA